MERRLLRIVGWLLSLATLFGSLPIEILAQQNSHDELYIVSFESLDEQVSDQKYHQGEQNPTPILPKNIIANLAVIQPQEDDGGVFVHSNDPQDLTTIALPVIWTEIDERQFSTDDEGHFTYVASAQDWEHELLKGVEPPQISVEILPHQSADLPSDDNQKTEVPGLWAQSAQLPNPQQDKAKAYTISIHYLNDDSMALLPPHIIILNEGEGLSTRIDSPKIEGYTTQSEATEIDIESIAQDYTFSVIYSPVQVTYKVNHYTQNLMPAHPEQQMHPENFTLRESKTHTGAVGQVVTANAEHYSGFTAMSNLPSAKITADGSTQLDVYYTYNIHYVYIDSTGGEYLPPIMVGYAQPLPDITPPSREGYIFAGWQTAPPATMPPNDITLTATWTPLAQVGYSVAYLLCDANTDSYNYITTITKTAPAGSVVTESTDIPSGVFDSTTAKYIKSVEGQNTTAVVAGDGSTVINVYFDRKDITFTFAHPGYLIVMDGVTYADGEYSITARYGQRILEKWPSPPILEPGRISKGNFSGWQGNLTYTNPVVYMSGSILSDTSFYAKFTTGSLAKAYYVYALPSLEHTEQNPSYIEDYNTVFYSNSSGLTTKQIEGFTNLNSKTTVSIIPTEEQSLYDGAQRLHVAHYSRNSYRIDYFSGGELVKTMQDIPYQTPLGEDYNHIPLHPDNLPNGYTFGGWKTTGTPATEQFVLNGQNTMPSSNLALYAIWVPSEHVVSFDVGYDELPPITQTVVDLEKAKPPANPTRDGFEFLGWYKEGEAYLYWFDLPVREDVYLTARWQAQNNTGYTVRYEDEDGTKLHMPKIVDTGAVGQLVLEHSVTVEGYVPDKVSKSIRLGAADNVIIFNYTKIPPTEGIGYTLRYVDQNGHDLLPPQVYYSQEEQVTAVSKNIPGYYPDRYSYSFILSADIGQNVVEFCYNKLPEVGYAVQSYTEGANGGYSLAYTDSTGRASPGIEVTAELKPMTGYTPNLQYSTIKSVVKADGSTILKIYYDLIDLQMGFVAGGGGRLEGETTINLHYFDDATQHEGIPTPIPDDGYSFLGWSPSLEQSMERSTTHTAMWGLTPPKVELTANRQTAFYTGEGVITLSATTDLPGRTYSYIWYLDGIKIEGQADNSLTLEGILQSGSYTVEVTAHNDAGETSQPTVSSAVEVSITYAKAPNSELIDGYDELSRNWSGGEGAKIIPKEGYTISHYPDGPYMQELVLSQEGQNVAKTIYLKNQKGEVYAAEIGYNYDAHPPNVNVVSGALSQWQKANAVVSFEVSDKLSGLQSVVVSCDDGLLVEQTEGEFVADRNGIYTITAADRAGNIGIKSVEIAKIDKTPPKIDITSFSSEGWYGTSKIEVAGSDMQSGIYTVVVQGGEYNGLDITRVGSFMARSDKPQSTSYTVSVTDTAGNISSEVVNINIDPRIDEFVELVDALKDGSSFSEIAQVNDYYENIGVIAQERIAQNAVGGAALQRLDELVAMNAHRVAEEFEEFVELVKATPTAQEIELAQMRFEALPEGAKADISRESVQLLERMLSDLEMAQSVSSQLRDLSQNGGDYVQMSWTAEYYEGLSAEQKELLTDEDRALYQRIKTEVLAVAEVCRLINSIDRIQDIAAAQQAYDGLSQAQKSIFPSEDARKLADFEDMGAEVEYFMSLIAKLPSDYEEEHSENLTYLMMYYHTLTATQRGLIEDDFEQKLLDMQDEMLAEMSDEESEKTAAMLNFYGRVNLAMQYPNEQVIEQLSKLYNELVEKYGALPKQVSQEYFEFIEIKTAVEMLNQLDAHNVKVEGGAAIMAYNKLNFEQKAMVDLATNNRIPAIEYARQTEQSIAAILKDAVTSERYEFMVEQALISLKTLPFGAADLVSRELLKELQKQYDDIVLAVGYSMVDKTDSTEVEVMGIVGEEVLALPEDSSGVGKTLFELMAKDSLTPNAPNPPSEKVLALSVDISIIAKLYKTEACTLPADTQTVEPAPGEEITIKLLMPSGYRLDTIEIWHVKDNGGRSKILDFTLYSEEGQNYVVFMTDSLSHFVVFAGELADSPEQGSGEDSAKNRGNYEQGFAYLHPVTPQPAQLNQSVPNHILYTQGEGSQEEKPPENFEGSTASPGLKQERDGASEEIQQRYNILWQPTWYSAMGWIVVVIWLCAFHRKRGGGRPV